MCDASKLIVLGENYHAAILSEAQTTTFATSYLPNTQTATLIDLKPPRRINISAPTFGSIASEIYTRCMIGMIQYLGWGDG